MIERMLAADFDGKADIYYHPRGISFRLQGTLIFDPS